MRRVRDAVVMRLNDEDLAEAFAYAPDHPLWKAIMCVAEAFREQCVFVSTDPDLSDKETNMALGGVSVMDDWIQEMERRAAMQGKVE